MDCIGSPTRKSVLPSPAVHPAVSRAISAHWAKDVSWNSSTRRCSILVSSARRRSETSPSVSNACSATSVASLKSITPRRGARQHYQKRLDEGPGTIFVAGERRQRAHHVQRFAQTGSSRKLLQQTF